MVSLVRWEPVVAEDYSSEIVFWARVRGIPLLYWEAGSFWAVGDAVGTAKEVDEDGGYVRVALNGFKPLIFNTIIPYDNGDEAKVKLVYEKLANHYKHFFRLSHLASNYSELCAQAELGRVSQEEWNKVGELQLNNNEEKGWEVAHKRSVKRALDMMDFASQGEWANKWNLGVRQAIWLKGKWLRDIRTEIAGYLGEMGSGRCMGAAS